MPGHSGLLARRLVSAYDSTMQIIGLSAAMLALVGALSLRAPAPVSTGADATASAMLARRCSIDPGAARALIRVERDTMLAFSPITTDVIASSGVAPSPDDALLARADTPMPAARVRLLRVDATTRRALSSAGITDSQPLVFIRAAPYRGDCRTIRYTDTLPWVRPGDVGYARGSLDAPERWIDGTPVIVIPQMWSYPYPRTRGVAYAAIDTVRPAPPEALFEAIEAQAGAGRAPNEFSRPDSAANARLVAWARANLAAANLEPIRSMVSKALTDDDASRIVTIPSRLRGSYRVTVQAGSERAIWYFRTHEKPGYLWRVNNAPRTVEDLLASPYAAGYQLVGVVARSTDSLPTVAPRMVPRSLPRAWFAVADRPFAPGNAARTAMPAELQFTLNAASEPVWSALDAFVPARSAMERDMLIRLNGLPARSEEQARIPLTVHIAQNGAIRADTTLVRGSQRLRITMERLDTLSIKRPW